MRHFLTSLLIFFISFSGYSQCIGDLIFCTQAEVDAFPTTYPGCTTWDGDIDITCDVQNVDALAQLTEITGTLIINSTHTNLDLLGFDNLVKIGGSFNMHSTQVDSVKGFSHLDTVGVGFGFQSNPNLKSIPDFNELDYVGLGFGIYGNDLDSISGFNQLERIQGHFLILSNSNLKSLTGFNSLNFVDGYYRVINNDIDEIVGFNTLDSIDGYFLLSEEKLVSINGLNQLSYVGDEFDIYSSPLFSSVANFSQLQKVEGQLTLKDLPALVNLNGFENLDYIGIQLWLFNNAGLTDISAVYDINTLGGLSIADSPLLTSITGFNNISTMSGLSMRLYGLQTLSGFNNLTTMPGIFQLIGVPATNITAFGSLTHAGVHVRLSLCSGITDASFLSSITSSAQIKLVSNTNLSDITGLTNINPAGLTNVQITNNPQLSMCGISNICTYFNGGGTGSVSGNLPDCETIDQIKNRCSCTDPTPSNDDCANPITLTESTFGTCDQILSATTACATNETNHVCGINNGEEVYYSFTPSISDTYDFTFSGNSIDLEMELYKGSCTSPQLLACSDADTLRYNLVQGVNYRLVIYAAIYTEFGSFDLCGRISSTSDFANSGVGIGTDSPLQKLEVVGGIKIGTTEDGIAGSIRYKNQKFEGHDGNGWENLGGPGTDDDPLNEIQVLLKTDSTVTLSGGGGSFVDTVDDADADATNELQTVSKSGLVVTLSDGGGSFSDAINDADADPTNEYNSSVALSGNLLEITDGGGTKSVDLSPVHSVQNIIADADSDTSVKVEEFADSDIIRMEVGGIEALEVKKNIHDQVSFSPPNLNSNTFFGFQSGAKTDPDFGPTQGGINTGFGFLALSENISGAGNTALGNQTLQNNDSGFYNTAVGFAALSYNLSGNSNAAVGRIALRDNLGSFNVAVGDAALVRNKMGDKSVALGATAASMDTLSSESVYVGFGAGRGGVLGSDEHMKANNTMVGALAGYLCKGSDNVFIGHQAGYNETGSDRLYIDNSITTSTSSLIYGEFDTDLFRINGTLDIKGNYQFPQSAGSNNQILKTNGSGVLTWSNDLVDDADANSSNELVTSFVKSGNNLNLTDAGGTKTVSLASFTNNWEVINPGDKLVYEDGNVGVLDANPSTALEVGGTTTTEKLVVDSSTGEAIEWDGGLATLNNSADALKWARPNFNMFLDSDNNNNNSSVQHAFKIFSNVSTSSGNNAIVQFDLHGGKSYLNTAGEFGVGTTNPSDALHVVSATGQDAFRVQVGGGTKMRVFSNGAVVFGNTGGVGADVVYVKGNTGLGVLNPSYKLELPDNADIGVGRARANAWITYSDQRIKKQVKDLDYGLQEVMALRPVRYNQHLSSFETGELVVEDMHSNAIGFIAQDVYEVINEVVVKPEDDSKDLWSMDYEKLTPVLVKAIQELVEKNKELSQRLDDQANLVQQLLEVKAEGN